MADQLGRIYLLVNADRLTYEVAEKAEKSLERISQGKSGA